MRATKFEFENRFWIIGLIFGIGFWAFYQIDQANTAAELLYLVAPSLDVGTSPGIRWLQLIFSLGACAVFLAALLRTWATAYLRTEVVHDAPQHSEALVADGPYRYVRNPLYLANLPMVAGMGVLASRSGWIFMVAAMGIFMYRLIAREEQGLLNTQGDSYRAYCEAVPRFWPALTPRVASGGRPPRWGQAIAGEMFFWLLGVAVLVFAITLNIKWTGIILVASFAVYFTAVYLVKKRARSERAAS